MGFSGSRKRLSRRIKSVMFAVFVALWILFITFPFYWTLISSLKEHSEMYNPIQTFYPRKIVFNHYSRLLERDYFHYYGNSAWVTLSSTLISVVVSFFAAYALVRMRFYGRKQIGGAVLFSYLVPASLLVIPLFVIMRQLHLINTFTGIILAYCAQAIPFSTWLLMSYFQTVPIDLEDAALVDGCSRFDIMFRILLPIVFPGIITTMIYSFVVSWNDLMYPLVFISNENKMLLPTMMSRFAHGESQYNWPIMLAGAVLMTIPPAALFGLLQRYVKLGLSEGAVKG